MMDEQEILMIGLSAAAGFAVAGCLFMLALSSAKTKLRRTVAERDGYREYASNVAHELKNPLAGIRTLADSMLQQSGVKEETYKEFLQDICTEIDRETNLIDNLRTMQELEGDGKGIAYVDAAFAVSQVVEVLKPVAAEREIALSFMNNGGENVKVDGTKLTLIVKNLVENAIKYNREKGWVRVELFERGKQLALRVSDNGIGIAKEDQTKIFDRFYRAKNADGQEGSGIGLALVKQTVDMMGGEINCISGTGEGTTFEVTLPVTGRS